ncbi:MAG: hypothetical protein QF662_09065, partial [Phycisphaerae bacterium]|nr:hypothetical protein [Phycisphaerae bacterium]
MRLFKAGPSKKQLPKPNGLAIILEILAVVVVLLAIAATVVEASGHWHTGYVKALAIALFLTSGISAAIVLVTLAILVRYLFSLAVSSRLLERSHRESQRLSQMSIDVPGADALAQLADDAGPANYQNAVPELLSEIVENTLLSEPERAEKRKHFEQRRLEAMQRDIADLIETTQWTEAQKLVEEFCRR